MCPVTELYGHGNENTGLLKDGELLDYVNDHWLLRSLLCLIKSDIKLVRLLFSRQQH